MAVLKTTSPCPRTSAPSALPMKERPSSRTRAASLPSGSAVNSALLGLHDQGRVDALHLLQADLYALVLRGGHVLAHVVRADGELSVAPVDEDRQLDRPGPPELDEGLHGGTGGAPVVDHVVDQHHRPI